MSRSHMLYDDQPLQQEGVKTSLWKSKWRPQEIQNGKGVLVEGIYHKKTRHVIQDKDGSKFRYCVFHVEFLNGAQRKYDGEGKEIEPNFGQTEKIKTGYLNSSYKTVAKGTPDNLTYSQMSDRVKSDIVAMETPSHAHSTCFWGDEDIYNHVECELGQKVRLKTKGDSVFIESFTKLDTDQRANSSNYTGGEKTGQSWTDKVLGLKEDTTTPTTTTTSAQESGEVQDDEWDD